MTTIGTTMPNAVPEASSLLKAALQSHSYSLDFMAFFLLSTVILMQIFSLVRILE